MCLQSALSTELYEAKNLVFNLVNRTLDNSNLNIFWQYFTTSISVVLNSFVKNRFIAKSNDHMSEAFSGQASRVYNKTDSLHIAQNQLQRNPFWRCSADFPKTALAFKSFSLDSSYS